MCVCVLCACVLLLYLSIVCMLAHTYIVCAAHCVCECIYFSCILSVCECCSINTVVIVYITEGTPQGKQSALYSVTAHIDRT